MFLEVTPLKYVLKGLQWVLHALVSSGAGFGDVGNHHPPHSSVLCIQQQLDVIGWF